MTLYLSQKALLSLFLSGFLTGVAAAVLYLVSDVLFVLRPRRAFGRVLRRIMMAFRDFFLFTAVGVADAILFFVYHSGRVRVTVFVLNFVGFCFCYYVILRPLRLAIRTRVRRLFRRNEDVL